MTHEFEGFLDDFLDPVFEVHGELFGGVCRDVLDAQRVGDIFDNVRGEQWTRHALVASLVGSTCAGNHLLDGDGTVNGR